MDLGRPGMLNPSHLGLPPRSFTFSGMTDPAKGVSPAGYRGGMLGTAHDYQSDFMLGDINKAPGAGTYKGGGGSAGGITPGGPTAQGGTAQGAGAGSWHGEGGVRQGAAAQGAGRGASAPNTAEAQGAPDPPDEAFKTAQQIVGAGQKAIGVAKALMPGDTGTGVTTGNIMGGEGAPSLSTGATSARVSAPGPTGTEPVSVKTEDILSPEGQVPGTPAVNLPTGATPKAGDIAAGGGMPSEFGVAGDINASMPGGSGGIGPGAIPANEPIEMATTGSQPVLGGANVNAPASALGAAGKVVGAAGAGLSAASAVKSTVDAIQSGDGAKIASAAAKMASAGISSIQEAGQLGLISKETMNTIAPALASAAPYLAMAGIVLGIAEHDPGAVVSGVGSTAVAAGVASGAIGGASALASGGLAALPAIAIMAGENRSQAIDARRARATRASMANFQAAPETQGLPKSLAALNAGDASQITAIGRSAGLALKVQYDSSGMDTAGGHDMKSFFTAVISKIPPQYQGQFYAEAAKGVGWDPTTAAQRDPYQYVTSILGAAPGPPPPGAALPTPQPGYSGGFAGVPTTPPVDPYAAYRPPAAPVAAQQQYSIMAGQPRLPGDLQTRVWSMGQGGGM